MDPGSGYDSSVPDSELHDSESLTDDDDLIARTKAELLACLDDVQTEGSFSAFHHASIFPNPGLHIYDHGSVGLPLAEKDAKAITSICQQAPFGRKSQTVIDTTVRRTWELEISRFECQNPSWPLYVDNLVRRTTSALGVSVPIRVEIYKMLLYEEGAFSKPHKDTEKVPGMFGTMVVCLPSHHEGGAVWLSHAGKTTVLDTSATSKFDLTVFAWYSDVTHEVKPLTSGYRLALTYNLFQDDPLPEQAASLLNKNRERLATSLAECHNILTDQSCFIYLLDHQYTEASLELEKLEGRDAAVGQYLNNVCNSNGFYFLLANMTGSFGEMNGDYSNEDEGSISLDHVFSPNGQKISSFTIIDKDNILDDAAFSGPCDSEDEEEFSGDESMPAAYRYHKTVVMLVPKSQFAEFFLRCSVNRDYHKVVVDFVANDLHAHPTGRIERELAGKVLRIVLEGIADDQLDQTSHFLHYSSLYNNSSRSTDFGSLLHSLGVLADNLQSRDIFRSLLQRIPITESSPDGLISFLASRMVTEALQTKTSDSCVWEQCHTCSSIKLYQNEDVDAVLALALHHPRLLQEKVLPIIERFGDRTSILNLLVRLSEQPLDSGVISHAYATLVQNARRLCPRPTATPQLYQYTHYNQGKPTFYTPYISQWPEDDAARFLAVMAKLWIMEQHNLVVALAMAMDLDLSSDQEGRQNFWDCSSSKVTRFITDLVVLVERYNYKSLTDVAKGSVLSALRDHATWVASKEPNKPNKWTRTLDRHHYCKTPNCSECHILHLFLQDPDMASTQFTMNKKKRAHVEHMLDRRLYTFITTYLGEGQNQTLIITKTNKEYEENLASWQRELADHRSNLQSLRGDFMEQMLGPESYKQFVLLELRPSSDLTSAASGATTRPLLSSNTAGNQAATVPPQVAGVKRKAEVIDLSGDD